KHLKEQLARLLDCGYFDHIPVPHSESLEEAVAEVVKKPVAPKRPAAGVPEPSVPLPKCEVPAREFLNRRYLPETDFRTQEQEGQPVPAWKAEFLALKQQEPPDSWDMEYTEKPASPPQSALKPWRAAPAPAPAPAPMPAPAPAPVPKEQVESSLKSVKLVQPICFLSPHGGVQRRERKSRPEQEMKVAPKSDSSPVAVFTSPSPLPADPELRKQKLQDLMEEIQGSFSFMQDSVLEGEGSPGGGTSRLKHSALGTSTPIVQREPKKCPSDLLPKALKSAPVPAAQIPPKLGLTNGEPRFPEFKYFCLLVTVCNLCLVAFVSGVRWPAHPATLIHLKVFFCQFCGSPFSLFLNTSFSSLIQVALIHLSQMLWRGVLNSILAARPLSPSPPQVFKVNAPLPPRSDSDMKAEPSSYSDSYSLSYSTASTQTPPECPTPSSGALEQDSLPPVSYPSDCVVSNGCPAYMSPGQHMGAFPRSSQPYYGRGAVRGVPRGARAPAHSYRSPSAYKENSNKIYFEFLQPVPLFTNNEDGFSVVILPFSTSGGFESYKNGMPSPGGNFIQPSYPARECTPILYGARESGFQQNYKRGGLTGQRASSRATWSDSSQVSSPERDNETFASVDSGQGDSRCITPIDVPVSAPGATLMPVHVYPLPQQMRVAFSAARTSNFAPGTLDQPIVFDLLLNNLGETFDMQLGRFSCPVNGTYVFIFHILKLAVNVPLYVNLMRNEEVMVSAYANDGAPDHETASNHAVLQLYQGDQIWLRLHRGAIYGSSWKYSTFSGYLLYQD
ncbi:CAPR2 protein, partial [Atractosteus spatula]|nr:CAPR2 protein [Atractosteus spatula]